MQQAPKEMLRQLEKAGVEYTLGEPLAGLTTFKIGGPAMVLAAPKTAAQLAAGVAAAKAAGVPHMLLGRGSNVLFTDEGYPGLLLRPSGSLCDISVNGATITAGAGADLMQVCAAARDAGLTGLEFAFGIPGSVGGAVYMNAGAYGGEMVDVLQSVQYIDEDGMLQTAQAKDLGLGYRTSAFQTRPWCIVSATVGLAAGDKGEIAEKMRDFMQRRADKQPLEYPSAGSAFKRPPGAFAGALIDQCGLRGFQMGGAAISQKHCGFIVNVGGATCADVLELADEVCRRVKQETGYELEKEIRVICP